jgi:hypothetical protein
MLTARHFIKYRLALPIRFDGCGSVTEMDVATELGKAN